jgi:hypothetical protein
VDPALPREGEIPDRAALGRLLYYSLGILFGASHNAAPEPEVTIVGNRCGGTSSEGRADE